MKIIVGVFLEHMQKHCCVNQNYVTTFVIAPGFFISYKKNIFLNQHGVQQLGEIDDLDDDEQNLADFDDENGPKLGKGGAKLAKSSKKSTVETVDSSGTSTNLVCTWTAHSIRWFLYVPPGAERGEFVRRAHAGHCTTAHGDDAFPAHTQTAIRDAVLAQGVAWPELVRDVQLVWNACLRCQLRVSTGSPQPALAGWSGSEWGTVQCDHLTWRGYTIWSVIHVADLWPWFFRCGTKTADETVTHFARVLREQPVHRAHGDNAIVAGVVLTNARVTPGQRWNPRGQTHVEECFKALKDVLEAEAMTSTNFDIDSALLMAEKCIRSTPRTLCADVGAISPAELRWGRSEQAQAVTFLELEDDEGAVDAGRAVGSSASASAAADSIGDVQMAGDEGTSDVGYVTDKHPSPPGSSRLPKGKALTAGDGICVVQGDSSQFWRTQVHRAVYRQQSQAWVQSLRDAARWQRYDRDAGRIRWKHIGIGSIVLVRRFAGGTGPGSTGSRRWIGPLQVVRRIGDATIVVRELTAEASGETTIPTWQAIKTSLSLADLGGDGESGGQRAVGETD